MSFIEECHAEAMARPDEIPTIQAIEARMREKAIRECIAALPEPNGCKPYTWEAHAVAYHALESLLPKKDRAREIFNDLVGHDEAMERGYCDGFKEAIRRLIDTGRLK